MSNAQSSLVCPLSSDDVSPHGSHDLAEAMWQGMAGPLSHTPRSACPRCDDGPPAYARTAHLLCHIEGDPMGASASCHFPKWSARITEVGCPDARRLLPAADLRQLLESKLVADV
jgi:hypothetical protein